MSIPVDFLVNLAAGLAYDLLRTGAVQLKTLALGEPAQSALRASYEAGFRAMLEAVAADLDRDHQTLLDDILRQFVAEPAVAQALLDMALTGASLPDLPALGQRFDARFDSETFPADFDRALTAFHRGLTEALVREASQPGSPLFNQVNLGRVIALQTLLQDQTRDLAAIGDRLARLETQGGGAVYNIVIEQATGVAIGDGATVEAALPPDVLRMLAEMLALLRQLHTARAAPCYSQEDLAIYLRAVIERSATLDLSGAGGPVQRLPLKRVYSALKADPSSVTERWANFQQLRADIAAAYEEALDARPEMQESERWKLWRAIAMSRDPMGLTLAFRNRANARRGDYLAAAAPRIDLGELIAHRRWVVLLGDPGAGKTTLVRWLAMQFGRAMLGGQERVLAAADQVRADEEQTKDRQPIDLGPARLPVPLRLADYAAARWQKDHDSALSLFDYLGRQPWQGQPLHPDPAVGQAIVQDALRQGRALLLLDGLDEISDQHRRGQVVEAIVAFLRTWVRDPLTGLCAAEEGYAPWQESKEARPQVQGGNQVLVTSRPIGYYLAPLPATLAHYTVEEMSEPAIARFCRAWTRAVHQETGQGDPAADAEALRRAVLDRNRPALRELAGNPLLLTILAGLFYTLKGKLPERRIELYDQVVRAFTRQRPVAWAAQGLTDQRFRFAMGYVAVELHANPAYANQLAGEDDLKEWLEDALQIFDGEFKPAQSEQAATLFDSATGLGGFLLERGDGAYGFIHRAFQEYFAALYLAHNPTQVADEVCSRLDEPAWREPLVLAVAQTGAKRKKVLPKLLQAILKASEPAPGLLPRNALFLAACLSEIEEPPDGVVTEVVSQLIAAYADRAWPADETTRPPQVLREAIERGLRPLRGQPGSQQALAVALTGDDPARRLAAGELILALQWRERALAAPLLAAARDWAEPTAAIREALWQQIQSDPGALDGQDLPLRGLLADEATVEALARRPVWLASVSALYLRPDWTADQPLAPGAVCFDSQLSPELLRGWQEGWDDEQLLEHLLALAAGPSPARARDAAWAVAVSDDARWRTLLAASGDGEGVAQRHALPIAGLAWSARALARARALDLDLALALARALALDLDLDLALARARALDLDLDLARDLDLALARARALALDLDLALARARALDLARARALALDLDLALARDLARALNEIEGSIAAAREKWAEQGGTTELRDALDSAAANAARLRAVLRQPAWRALASAAELLPSPGNTSSQSVARVAWSAEHLDDAGALGPELLARLRPPDSADAPAVRARFSTLARGWLDSPDARRRSYAGLLSVELGELTPDSLHALLPLLAGADDLLRWRARAALQQERLASAYGQEALWALAQRAGNEPETPVSGAAGDDGGAWLISAYCGWTLNAVIHDQPEWLAGWAAAADEQPSGPAARLLSHIHRLDERCWPAFLDLLQRSRPRGQEALLASASWLLRDGQVPDGQAAALGDLLCRLAQSAHDEVARSAAFALGCFRQPPPAVVAALLAAVEEGPATDGPWPLPQVWTALARLAPRLGERQQDRATRPLAAAPASPEVDGALARWLIGRLENFDAQTAVRELAALRSDPTAQLRALLAAGADDDVWDDDYHERIALSVRALLDQHAELWPLLTEELRAAWAAGRWPRHRIALACLARGAEAMPAQFNRAAADLTPLLLQASQDAGSHNSRRFAISALSYLRVITPEVLAALLRLAGDTEIVQEDALAAATRFNRLDPSLGEALPDELTRALSGPSVLRARTATRLLEALGTSQATQSAPGLRQQIVHALAAALQDPGSRRPVWVSTEGTDGTLDQDLYRALLQVAGF